MKLVVPVPPGWQRASDGPPAVLASADGAATITASAILPLPDAVDRWVRAELSREAAGAPVDVVARSELATAAGWPAFAIEARVGVAVRLLVVFRFLELGAWVMVRAPDADAFAPHRAAVAEALVAAAPDWSGQGVLSLHEFFRGVAHGSGQADEAPDVF